MHMQSNANKFKRMATRIASLVCAILFAATSLAATLPLPVEKAFQLKVMINRPQLLTAQFIIAPGYYLYRQRMHVEFNPAQDTTIHFPPGQLKVTPRRDSEEVYSNNLVLPIILATHLPSLLLKVDYQGCSAHGFCYPPIHKDYHLNLLTQQVTPVLNQAQIKTHSQVSLQTLLTDQNQVSALFSSKHVGVMILIFTGLGLLLAFTPCVLPMIPILTSIIAGHKEAINTKKAFWLSVCYVLASASTYALLGVMVAEMGHSLQTYLEQPWIIAVVSGLFVLLALSLFGFYDLRLPNKWQNKITAISRQQRGGTYPGVFIMGIISTLIVSPCVTAPLVGVLMYIAQTGDTLLGASALFALGIGMGIPLIIIGTTAGKWLPKKGAWMIGIQKIFGVFMLIMAAWLLSRVHSNIVISLFFACLLLTITVYFSFNKQKLTTAVLVELIGLLVLVGGISLQPKLSSMLNSTSQVGQFTVVHNISELNNQLLIAQTTHRPVMLDFYADWCESCVTMDQQIFAAPIIKNALNQFVLLRADLSANSSADEILLQKYAVVAPPMVIFFNNQGQEVNSRRIVGEINVKDFLSRLNTFFTASCDKNLQC